MEDKYIVYGHKHPMAKDEWVYIGHGKRKRAFTLQRAVDHIIWFEDMLRDYTLQELVTVFCEFNTKEEALAYEVELIKKYQPKFNNFHTDEYVSPHKGRELSEEWRKKLSDAKIGEKNHRFGKPSAMRGKVSPMKGHKHSAETKEKMRQSRLAYVRGGH